MKPIIDKQGQGVQLFLPEKESECSGEVVYKKILHQDGTEKPNRSFWHLSSQLFDGSQVNVSEGDTFELSRDLILTCQTPKNF